MPQERPTPTSPSTIQELKARPITATRSRIHAPEDGRADGAIASPTHRQRRGDLSPHFSAIPFFRLFSFLSAITQKNHLLVFSVSRKKEKKTKKVASLYSRFFAVSILARRRRRWLHSRRDPFSKAMGQPQPSLPPPSFCHPFFCHCSFVFFRFFCYHRNSLCARPAWRGLSALIFTRWAHFTWGVAPGWYGSGLWPYNHRHATVIEPRNRARDFQHQGPPCPARSNHSPQPPRLPFHCYPQCTMRMLSGRRYRRPCPSGNSHLTHTHHRRPDRVA